MCGVCVRVCLCVRCVHVCVSALCICPLSLSLSDHFCFVVCFQTKKKQGVVCLFCLSFVFLTLQGVCCRKTSSGCVSHTQTRCAVCFSLCVVLCRFACLSVCSLSLSLSLSSLLSPLSLAHTYAQAQTYTLCDAAHTLTPLTQRTTNTNQITLTTQHTVHHNKHSTRTARTHIRAHTRTHTHTVNEESAI